MPSKKIARRKTTTKTAGTTSSASRQLQKDFAKRSEKRNIVKSNLKKTKATNSMKKKK